VWWLWSIVLDFDWVGWFDMTAQTAFPMQKLPRSETPQEIILAFEISCAANSRSKNIAVEAIIIAEPELCNVKMQIFFADIVESADDPARRMELWFRKIIENDTVYTIAVIIVGLIPIAFLVAMFVLH
jgi:hypothetical protein